MPNVFTYDAAYLSRQRNAIKDSIASARYRVGMTWYPAKIESREILSDGRIEVRFTIDHTVTGGITVTSIELLDHNGDRIGSKDVSIRREDAIEGIFYVCRLSLFQVVENEDRTGAYDAL